MLGVRLGIDVGKARIGVARCDPLQTIAVPLETVARTLPAAAYASAPDAGEVHDDIERIAELVTEYGAVDVVVGLPLNMRGESTASTADAELFAQHLAARLRTVNESLTVRLIDERLSTVSAQQQLRQAGRNTKNSRGVIDQAAATVILQHTIDMDRRSTTPVGRVVSGNTDR